MKLWARAGTMTSREASDGVILVDKPEGPTSHDVVTRARRALGVRRIGHAGTLDPFASGLLILCVGRSTRLVEYLHLLSKRYRAVATLGARTDTDDREGSTIARSEAWREVTRERLMEVVERLRRERMQRPPDFSAKKVGGKRAYETAREGGIPRLAPVSVHIHSLEVVEFQPPEVVLECAVSTGTYIRALARDLGEEIGCHAHLSGLRRTAIGPFSVTAAASPEELTESALRASAWLTPARAVAWMPARDLSEAEIEGVTNGRPVPWGDVDRGTRGPVALLAAGRLVGVARGGPGGLHPEKVFPLPDGGP